jgi:hypothetical protein
MKWMSAVGLLLIGCVIALAASATPSGPDVPPEADLTGKLLVVSAEGPARGAMLRQARQTLDGNHVRVNIAFGIH